MASRYDYLLRDRDILRWHENVARGSQITADVYLRRLGSFCEVRRLTPKSLLKLKDRQLYNLFLDAVSAMETTHAGGYIASILKAVKSWLAFNDRAVRHKIRIKGAHDTPTLADERVPTQEELRKIFLSGDEKARAVCILMAHAGLRPEVLGTYQGTDGLRLGDLPELELQSNQANFQKVPTMIRVRAGLSKTSHEYFTFLGNEGCDYLKAYLELRLRHGEKLTNESPVITPKSAHKPFIRTINIGDAARKAIRKAGLPWRPYVLRSYFATQMMMAEAKGMVIRDYRAFFMGHSGDIEAVYTLNKRMLPVDVIEQMRESYAKAQKYLQTIETERAEDVTRAFKRQLLLVVGFTAEEIKDEYLELGDEEFQKLAREKLTASPASNGARQKVVNLREVELHLSHGWEFVGTLPNHKAVLKLAN
jgi:site-specific recombinase XerD